MLDAYGRRNLQGFTIVELLIVIVVIAILAAITIVAYNGIQERAKSTRTITAAKEAIKIMQLYKTTKDAYPYPTFISSHYACFGEYANDVCQYINGGIEVEERADFKTAIASVGTMPQPDTTMYPLDGNRIGGGVFYQGIIQAVVYYLPGLNRQCTAGGTSSNTGGGTTQCTYMLA